MFKNHQGGREANFQHGEDYKGQIIDYWKERGYDLIADSAVDNITPDLIFRKTHEHGNEDIYVESKYTKLSRTEKPFLTEMARYLIEFQNRHPFDFHIFVRDLSAHQKWRKIFDPALSDSEVRHNFWERVLEDANLRPEEEEKLEQFTEEQFKAFLDRTCIHKAGYDTLKMETEHLQDSSKFDVERFTTQEEPFNERSPMEPNFGRIASHPENLYIGNIHTSEFKSSITHSYGDIEPIWFEEDRVFSLRPPDELPSSVRRVTDEDSFETNDFQSWAAKEENKLASKILLLQAACGQAVEKDYSCHFKDEENGKKHELMDNCSYLKYRGDYYLLFEHPYRLFGTQKVESQQITKAYDDFVRHRAAKLNVHKFGEEYYLSILVKNLFTEKGTSRTLIRGERNRSLHDSFNQNNYNNSQAYSEYKHWRNILPLRKSEPQETADQELGFTRVQGISVSKRPPENLAEAEEQDRDTEQQQLGQF